MVVLRALGTAEIETEVTTLTPSQVIVFAAALYLILERGKRVSRARLASLLWPRVPEKVRAHRLRQTLFQLKKLGIVVRANRTDIELSDKDVCTDFDDLSVNTLHSVAPTTIEFLPGYDPHFSPPFRDWIDTSRGTAHTALTRVLLASLQTARESGNWIEVERLASNLLGLDPLNEAAVLARAEAFAMRGQKAAAVSMLDRYIEELSPDHPSLVLPATILRKRVSQHAAQSHLKPFAVNEPDFVGRTAEMAILTKLLEKARRSSGAACLISGEPGIGKTRISSELARFAQLQGVRVERIACKRADMHQPLSAFVALVPNLRELPGALGCSQQSLIWLKRLTEFDTSSESPAARAEDSGTLYINLRSAVFDLLDAVSDERCLALIVEDVQWLDRHSAKLFGSIIEWIPTKKVFVLFNSREQDTRFDEAVAPYQFSTIHLTPLNNRDATTVVQTVIGHHRSGATDEYDWLIGAGDGNPYFLQELAKHWMETGRRYEIPSSVAIVLDERVSRLSGVARQLLQACAVLGENSNLERVEQVLAYRPYDLLSGLQELSATGMLRSVASAEVVAQSLQVPHDLLSMQVLNALTPAALAFLHRRCGIALEREVLGTSISTSLLRACAFHWHQSGDSDRAYGLAIKCANHLLEIGLAADGAAALEGALAFCTTIERQLEVLERVVQALRMARESPALLNTISRIRSLQDAGPSQEHHDELEIIELEARRATESTIGTLFSRTLSCVYNTALPPAHRVSVACVALKLASGLPDLMELRRIYSAVRPFLTDAAVDTRSRLQVEVIYNTMAGDFREAIRLAKERVAFERQQGTSFLLTNAMTDLSFVLRRTGPEEEVITVLSEAYQIAMERKLYAPSRDYAERMASFLIATRRAGVELWMQRAVQSHGDTTEPHISFSLNGDRARIALLENRIDDADEIVEREFPWEWLRHRRGWLAAANALRIRVQLRRRQQDITPLARAVDELRALYDSTAMLGGQDYEVAALCAGLVETGDEIMAQAYLTDYLSNKRRDLTRYSPELTEICGRLLPSQREFHLRALPMHAMAVEASQ